MSQSRFDAPSLSGSLAVAMPPGTSPSMPSTAMPVSRATPSRIRLSTGVTLEYVAQGRDTGAPVVFIHGMTDSWYSFAPVLPHMPASVRTFALSMRGHGRSERPASGYAMRDMAADVIAFLDAKGIASATLVGHSMGARVALRTVVDHPARVQGVMLIGAFAPALPNDALDELDAGVRTLADPVPRSFAREFQEGTLAQPAPDGFVDAMIAESLRLPAAIWREALAGFLADDVSGALADIRVPVHLVWGANDAFVPQRDQEVLMAMLPDVRFDTYLSAGHAVHWEEPRRVARDIVSLLMEVSRRQRGRLPVF